MKFQKRKLIGRCYNIALQNNVLRNKVSRSKTLTKAGSVRKHEDLDTPKMQNPAVLKITSSVIYQETKPPKIQDMSFINDPTTPVGAAQLCPSKEVRSNQSCNLKKTYTILAFKYLLQLLIADDNPLVFRVLKERRATP